MRSKIILLSVASLAISSAFLILLPMVSGAGTLYNIIVAPTNNLFNVESFYAISFTTATDSAIHNMTITFPAGFGVANAKFIESNGLALHFLSVNGQSVNLAPNQETFLPHGTSITLMLGNIVNNQSPSNTVTITTRDLTNSIIDGPTKSPTFTLKPAGTTTIANGAVTLAKMAPNSVNTAQIVNGSITKEKFAPGVLTVGPPGPPGPVGPTTEIIRFSGGLANSVNGSPIFFNDGTSYSEPGVASTLSGANGTITKFYYSIGTASGSGVTVQATLYVNGVSTGITCSLITGTSPTSCESTTKLAVSSGDLIAVLDQAPSLGLNSPLSVSTRNAFVVINATSH